MAVMAVIAQMAFGVMLLTSGMLLIVFRRSYAKRPPWYRRRFPERYLLAEAAAGGILCLCIGCGFFVLGIFMVS